MAGLGGKAGFSRSSGERVVERLPSSFGDLGVGVPVGVAEVRGDGGTGEIGEGERCADCVFIHLSCFLLWAGAVLRLKS